MPEVSVQVEIPEGWELADSKMRVAKKGEWYIAGCEAVQAVEDFPDYYTPLVIVRPAWQWPTWLTAEWIAMDECKLWYAYQQEPSMSQSHWHGGDAWELSDEYLDFTPPPCTDWRTSKRRNPSL